MYVLSFAACATEGSPSIHPLVLQVILDAVGILSWLRKKLVNPKLLPLSALAVLVRYLRY